jgi:hypothetical protein
VTVDWPKRMLSALQIRFRAVGAMRCYARAHKRYAGIEAEMAVLHERRKALLEECARKAMARELTDAEKDRITGELNKINEGFYLLCEPFERADAAMEQATERARSVLRDGVFLLLGDEA